MSSGSGSFVAGSITSGLKFDVSDYVGGMMKVNSIAQLFPSVVTSFLANPLLGVVDILKSATSALFEFGKDCLFTFTSLGDQIGDTAEALGIGAQQFQEVAAIFGTGSQAIEQAAETLKFLGKATDDALHGGTATASAFHRLGIEGADLKMGMNDLPGLLFKVSDGLMNLQGADRIGVSLDILGRNAGRAMEELAKGSGHLRRVIEEMRSAGGFFSDADLERADQYDESMKSLSRVWAGFKLNVGGPMLETLLPELMKLVEWAKNNKEQIIEMAREIAKAFVWAIDQIISQIRQAMPLIEGFTKGGAWGGIGATLKYAAGSAWNYSLPGWAVNSMVGTQAPGAQNPWGPSPITVKQQISFNGDVSQAEWESQMKKSWFAFKNELEGAQRAERVRAGL
jgi:hypothetical protein